MAAALARRAICQRKLHIEPFSLLASSSLRNFSCGTRPLLQEVQVTTQNPWTALDETARQATKTIRKMVENQTREEPPEVIWRRQSIIASEDLEKTPPNHPYVGRSVRVVDGNITDAFQRLDRILNRNAVRGTWRADERHERKGEKRRRLKSTRWRKVFAHHVRKSVQLVTKIRTRGA
ncbi:hypothetical protein VNI00_003383 [Paramarasmius palmivorus]|uniref:Uncharacterized protein n=1 Tax=Paramarasmius palmivorus TaxID=297713 RepID=A0AAW0DS05_9AGAR